MARKTTMAAALNKAGYQDANQRLREIADAALNSPATTTDEYVAFFYKEVSSDARLLYALFAPWMQQAVQIQLADARQRRQAQRQDNQPRPRQRTGSATVTPLPSLDAAKDAVMARKCALDTVIVNGRPVGEQTPEELRNGIIAIRRNGKLNERKARFAEYAMAGVPDNKLVKDYIKPDEADRILARVEAEVAIDD